MGAAVKALLGICDEPESLFPPSNSPLDILRTIAMLPIIVIWWEDRQ